MRTSWQLPTLAIVLVVVVGAVLVFQRQANRELRGAVDLLREQNREVDRLHAEHSRLVTAQVPAAELERMRADHAAVIRLRGEIEAAKARIIEMERAESAPPVHD